MKDYLDKVVYERTRMDYKLTIEIIPAQGNGKSRSCPSTRHFEIRYVYVTEMIRKKEIEVK
jgi:hypothetical protein